MSVFELPLRSDDPSYTRRFQLDGVTFILLLDWSDVAGYWFLSISDLDGNPVVAGIKCVVDVPLLRQYVDTAVVPAGELVFVDPGDGGDPGREDMGDRVTLLYTEAES